MDRLLDSERLPGALRGGPPHEQSILSALNKGKSREQPQSQHGHIGHKGQAITKLYQLPWLAGCFTHSLTLARSVACLAQLSSAPLNSHPPFLSRSFSTNCSACGDD